MTIRTLFFGTPGFALPTLDLLYQTEAVELTGVLTQPDRPAGRGNKLTPPPVKEFALAQGIDLLQPQKLKDPDVLPWLEKHQPDLIVVVAYGGFVPKPVRNFPKFGCVNLHPSHLPKYRGAAPMQWTIMNGDKETANSIFYLSAGWDDGDIIYQENEPVHPDDTYDSLSERLSHSGARLMVKAVVDIGNGTAPRVPQPEEGVVLAPLISNDDARIDWTCPAADIHNKVRGLCSIPGAFTMCGGERWKVFRTEVINQKPEAAPGTVIHTNFNTVQVAAADAVVEILELQPAGKRRMKAADFLRGKPIQNGTTLG